MNKYINVFSHTMFLKRPSLDNPPQHIPPHPYNFPLDAFQLHAISAISKDENVLVCAKTGSGKTLVGEYQIYHSLLKNKRVFYTTPIKSLSNQKYFDLKMQFKDASVGIMTGDIKFCPDAQIVIMTTEILRNLLYKKGTTTEHLGLTASISIDNLDAVIFDECHFINDKDRGKIWEETMILLPPEINMVMLSATLDHPEYFANWIGELKQKHIHLIETTYRVVPLTHNVLDNNFKLMQLMNEKDVYNEKTYADWLKMHQSMLNDRKVFQKKVADARRIGIEGAIDGKVQSHSFVHQMNATIKMLDKTNLLPALFFVFSRKQCELYASKVEETLLTSSDISTVKHIISFHLHRHIKELEKLPQYFQLYDLLCRGIAFHHSGLIPVLKEIVELLFSKGYVKIMFCTETFAVGLNMPTKTVLFAGLKKYDEQLNGLRILRSDEYIQMAGRAGRRGKDDKGVVIYLPDKEPIESSEMKSMMKGTRPPITSRMDFHYDFILKTIQASSNSNSTPDRVKWLTIMEKSYWFQQRLNQIKSIKSQIVICHEKIGRTKMEDLFFKECEKRDVLEQQIKSSVNSERKALQRQLDAIKNKQLGPKWANALANYVSLKALNAELVELENVLFELEKYKDKIRPSISFLYKIGYIKTDDPLSLTTSDLTLKGLLATEINEGHQILMTELYIGEIAHNLSNEDVIGILACFQDGGNKSEDDVLMSDLNVSDELKNAIIFVTNIANEFESIEDECGYAVDNYWKLSLQMIEPMQRWFNGENISIICHDYNIFEGNFIRAVMKMANILDEWLSLATYCQHIEQINKIMDIRKKIIRDIVITDSLYLHL